MVVCEICGYKANKTIQAHLNHHHKMNNKSYTDMFPDAKIYSDEYLKDFSEKIRKFTQTYEYREKLSESSKRLWRNSEFREKISEKIKVAQNTKEAKENHKKGINLYFKNRTDYQKIKHNEALKESWKDPVKRNNRVDSLKKAHNLEKAKLNHSKATKNYFKSLSEDEKEVRNRVLKDTWAKPENREKLEKIIKMGLLAANTDEARKKIKETNKTPETKAKRSRAAIKNLLRIPIVSSLNIKFEKALNEAGLFPEPEYTIDFYMVDFCFPDKKIVVEVDGDYWHCNPVIYSEPKNKQQKRVVSKDKREKTFLINRGWTLLRFWEKDINFDIRKCINIVKEAINAK